MNAQRQGSHLKTDIAIALHSLGRDYKGATKGKTIVELKAMLVDLRKEQVKRGIIKSKAA